MTNNSMNYSPSQYNVQVGGTSGSLVNIAPSSTAGTVLKSAGASSNPIYSTAAYPVTSSTSGNVVTSNGSNFISQNASGFSPNSSVQFFDDFISFQRASPLAYGQLGWSTVGTWHERTSGVSNNNPGVLDNNLFAGDGSTYFSLFLGQPSDGLGIILGGGTFSMNWVIEVATLSTSAKRYTLQCGLLNTQSVSTATSGIYFSYNDSSNSGRWVCSTLSASSGTSSNSSTTVINSAFVNLGISVNAAASSVSFTVNGVSIVTAITTNIPTVALIPFLGVQVGNGINISAVSFLVDLFYMNYSLTNPR